MEVIGLTELIMRLLMKSLNSLDSILHLLKRNSDNTFSIVSGTNEETDIPTARIYNIDTVHGWLNPETCQFFPPWYVDNNQFSPISISYQIR